MAMKLNNEQNIKRRIGILTFFVLLICGGMIWAGIKLVELQDNSGLLFWQNEEHSKSMEKLIKNKFNDVMYRIDSLEPAECIDSPIDPLPADTKGDKEDSIRNILKDILKYYEQSTTRQEATA